MKTVSDAPDLDGLAAAAAGGDTAALDRLLAACHPLVLARANRLLPNPLDAEEAAQDALVAVARRISSFEGRSRFTTWLYQVTTNAALDTYRKLKRRVSVIDLPHTDIPAAQRTSVAAGNRVDLLEALDKIDPRFGEPVVMRDVYGLDYAEIAQALQIPTGTVKSRIHEGRRALQFLISR